MTCLKSIRPQVAAAVATRTMILVELTKEKAGIKSSRYFESILRFGNNTLFSVNTTDDQGGGGIPSGENKPMY